MSEAQALVHGLTNFYPLYGAANDQVDPVLRVQPVLFQRVLPRYRLSTRETRDQGLGPMFANIPESPGTPPPGKPRGIRTETLAGETGSQRPAAPVSRWRGGHPAPEPWLGRRVDLFA